MNIQKFILPVFMFLLIPFIAGADTTHWQSSWSGEKRSGIPDTFWKDLRAAESQWPRFIEEEKHKYNVKFGPGIDNAYDLFIKETNCNAPDGILDEKTLKRLVDLSWIPARKFETIKGVPACNIRLFSCRFGMLEVIPFDILEVSEKGRLVLPYGIEGNPDDSDGVFSGRDILFFMLMDSGHRIDKSMISKKYPGVANVEEIEIARDGKKAWVYAASFDGTPPAKSNFRYVRIYGDLGLTMSPYMIVQNDLRNIKKDHLYRKIKGKKGLDRYRDGVCPACSITAIGVAPSLGGQPSDFYDHFNINLEVGMSVGGKRSKTEKDIDPRWRAWYEGDVISYVRSIWAFNGVTPFGMGTPVTTADSITSAFCQSLVDTLYMPFDPGPLLDEASIALGKTMSEPGCRIITREDRSEFLVDGRMSGDELHANDRKDFIDDESLPVDKRKCLGHVVVNESGSAIYKRAVISDDMRKMDASARSFFREYSDTPEAPGKLVYTIRLGSCSTRNQCTGAEYYPVPFFMNPDGSLNWENYDLVERCGDLPVSYSVGGRGSFVADHFVFIPDMETEMKQHACLKMK